MMMLRMIELSDVGSGHESDGTVWLWWVVVRRMMEN